MKKREVKYSSSAVCVVGTKLWEKRREDSFTVVSENTVGVKMKTKKQTKTKQKKNAEDSGALTVGSRAFSWLKTVNVAGVSRA